MYGDLQILKHVRRALGNNIITSQYMHDAIALAVRYEDMVMISALFDWIIKGSSLKEYYLDFARQVANSRPKVLKTLDEIEKSTS